MEYLRFGSLIGLIGKCKKIWLTLSNRVANISYKSNKIILERKLNEKTDRVGNGNARISGKLQPVAVKVLHPGIKGQLRYGVYYDWYAK